MDNRPEVLPGNTRALDTGCGTIYVTINADENGHTVEVFATLGKAGGCASAQTESIGRLVSGWLQDGATEGQIVRKIKGISCNESRNDAGIFSCAHAIAVAIEKEMEKKGHE